MQVVDAVLAGRLGQHHRQRGGNVEDVGRLHAVHGLRDPVAVAAVGIGRRAEAVRRAGEALGGIVSVGGRPVVRQVAVGVIHPQELAVVACALDNIFTERLWRTVKYEEVYLNDYQTPREARLGLTRYFESCNYQRPHQALAYRTPAEVYCQKGAESTLNPVIFLS
jgi:hypothetical protein